MSFTIHISDRSGVISADEIEQMQVVLTERGVSASAIHRRAIPETSKDLGAHSKFHLVWITGLGEPQAQEIAEKIEEAFDKSCRVSEAK